MPSFCETLPSIGITAYLLGITIISLILPPFAYSPSRHIRERQSCPRSPLLHTITVGETGEHPSPLLGAHGFWQNPVNGKELVPIVYFAAISSYLFTVLFRSAPVHTQVIEMQPIENRGWGTDHIHPRTGNALFLSRTGSSGTVSLTSTVPGADRYFVMNAIMCGNDTA